MALQSEKSFPFDAELVNGVYDRKYVADDFARYFKEFISSGMLMKESTNLQVLANGDMTVTLKKGSMIIDGVRYDNIDDIIFELTPADGVLNRIDRVSIVYDKTNRDIHAEVLEGVPSYEPVAQSIRRTEEYRDYISADIYVAAGVVSITQSAITDQRINSEVCGVSVPFNEIDTSTIFNQFAVWFEETKENGEASIQKMLSEMEELIDQDVALHLENQINNTNENIMKHLEDKENPHEVTAKSIGALTSEDIVDNLESTATNLPLSAKQGNVLKEHIINVTACINNFRQKDFVDTVNSNQPWNVLKNNFTSLVNGQSYVGRINNGAAYSYYGTKVSDIYGSFMLHNYDNLVMHVYVQNGVWYRQQVNCTTPVSF